MSGKKEGKGEKGEGAPREAKEARAAAQRKQQPRPGGKRAKKPPPPASPSPRQLQKAGVRGAAGEGAAAAAGR